MVCFHIKHVTCTMTPVRLIANYLPGNNKRSVPFFPPQRLQSAAGTEM